MLTSTLTSTTATTYTLPPGGNAFDDWRGYQRDDFVPTPRQQLVAEAVRAAREAGCLFQADLVKRCELALGLKAALGVQALSREASQMFDHDVYLARGYLEARARVAAERSAWERLKPVRGLQLGTLVFQDCKRTTNVVVTDVEADGRFVQLAGRRGRLCVEIRCAALSLACAMDRASERHLRATSFDQFVGAALTAPATVVGTRSADSTI